MTYVTTNTSAMAHTREGVTSSALGLSDALAFSLAAGIGGALVASAGRGVMTERNALIAIWCGAIAVALVAAFFAGPIDGRRA